MTLVTRRSAVKLLGGALGSVVCGTTTPAQKAAPAAAASSPDAWPQFRGTPPLTGISAAAPPATRNLFWTFKA